VKGPVDRAADGVDRTLIAGTYLVFLLAFFITQRIFAGMSRLPSWSAMALVLTAIAMRVAELGYFHRRSSTLTTRAERYLAIFSIVWASLLPLPLAIASRESDTPYFGLLMLPILETAVYFSFRATLIAAFVASIFPVFWIFYAGHFHPPFAVGEMLESATIVLAFFIVGSLVSVLMDRIRQRNQELAQHADDLEKTRSRLIEQEKLAAVGRLASSIAHEIRNPVAIISSALEASGSGSFAPLEREEMNRVAMTEARRLVKLTSDFLSYANLSAEPFERLNLGTLAGYVEGIVRVQAREKRLHVDLQVDTVESSNVQGNEGQIQQVLLNLLRNAVEAAPEGSAIRVRVHSGGSGEAMITIENGGPAIPVSATERIFEPFYTNKPNGTGLGLAIARRIVERHGGMLYLERNEQDHVMFTMTLPIQAPSHNPAQGAAR
jgi:two-component system, NtrC family, sensor histidine kinase HydH